MVRGPSESNLAEPAGPSLGISDRAPWREARRGNQGQWFAARLIPTSDSLPRWPATPLASLGPWCAHGPRSEEHTSELQSLRHLVCRLLLEKKKHRAERSPLTRPPRERLVRYRLFTSI